MVVITHLHHTEVHADGNLQQEGERIRLGSRGQEAR